MHLRTGCTYLPHKYAAVGDTSAAATARGSGRVGCARRQAAAGGGLGELLVGVGRGVVGLPGAGGTEHGQDGAYTPTDSSWGRSGGGVARGRAVVGLGERGRRDRERERRDAMARVGLGGVLPGRLAGGGVRLREVRVTTRR
jgi:hypothetical protein